MAERPPEPSAPPELVAATEEPIVLVGERASARLTVPPSTRARFDAAPWEARLVLLTVDDIAAERDPGFVYAVFLNPPEGAGEDELRVHHIGNVSLFGIQLANDPDRGHEGVPGLRHTFDVTEAVRMVAERNQWNAESVIITFDPVRVLPPPREEPVWASVALSEEPSIPVTVGSVRLFAA